MTLPILIDLNAALLFIAVAVFITVRRPPEPLWPSLIATQMLALTWIAGDIGTHLSRDLFWEQFFIDLVYAGSYGVAAAWWVLGFRFAEAHGVRPAWVSRPVVFGPAVFAGVVWLCVATNPLHGQFLTPVIGGRNEYQWMWWVSTPVAYGLVIAISAGYGLLYRRLADKPGARRQCRVMLIATLATLVSNAAYTLAPVEWPLDVSVVGGLTAGLLFVVGIYRGTLFNLPPAVMRDLLNRDPTALLIADRKGRLIYANSRAQEFFARAGLVLGCEIEPQLRSVLHPPDPNDRALTLAQIWADVENREFAGSFYLATRSGRKTHLWVTAQGLSQPGKQAEALILRFHDMTRIYNLEAERRTMERRLAQSDRLRSLGSLSAGIAHEVKNPVGSALLAAQYALNVIEGTRDRALALEVATDALQTVSEQSERAARVTRAMLRFAREGSGERTVGDLRALVTRSGDFTRELARKHGATVHLDLFEDPPPVRFNETEMEQVLVNLIHNAILSGKPGRRVDVEVETMDDRVRITVADDGNGMTTEQCQRAFEPFHTSRDSSSGSGLGLSVVHGIVTDHGGEVWLESEVGLGTSAIIELPIWRG